ncbi:MAG: PD-(D/E)XK nuclease family protein [Candidatus Omnitrophica bacterium]|nr:PD-(D/E)XK nuclease family protein [Candidatus Omnitrophota bacterium]
MKKLLVFPFGYRNKTETLLSECLKRHPSEALYIAPHMSKVRDFKMSLHRIRPEQSLLPAAHTIKTLALSILDACSEKRIISEVEKYITVLRILEKKKTGAGFASGLPGMALAVSRFIRDIKISSEGPVPVEEIKKKIAGYEWRFDYNSRLLLFAVDAMGDYGEFLRGENLIDTEDIYKEASGFMAEKDFREIVFEGFCEMPPYQKSFIRTLIEKDADVFFSTCYDEGISPDVKELILEKSLDFLKQAVRWEEKRFGGGEASKTECCNFSSQPEEIAGIVKIIHGFLNANLQCTLNDVMTVFPSMPSYRPVVQRIFGRYGLPCEIIPGYSLSQDSSVSTLLDFFAFRNTYDWEVLMNLILSPHLHKMDFEEAGRFSAASRESFAKTGFLKENFYKLEGRNFNIVKSAIERMGDKPKALRKWVDDVNFMAEASGWKPGLTEVGICFGRVMEDIKTDTVFSREEFVNTLRRVFELVEVEEGRGSGVKVSGVQESVGLEKKLCVVGGATEENIPNAPSVEEVFMPDALKKELGFTDYALRIARERLDLHRLKSENENVIFTYPSKAEGKNQMKSIFLFGCRESAMEGEEFNPENREMFSVEFSEEKFRKRFIPEGRLKISVTQMESLMKCPYRFYLRYVEDIQPYRTPEADEAPDLWGNIIHGVMQEIFKGSENKVMAEEDSARLDKLFRESVNRGIKSLYAKGAISGFYRDVLLIRSAEVCRRFGSIIAGRAGYTFVDAEVPVSCELPFLHLTGKIDRIEETPAGEINVADIKTSTAEPPSYTEKDFFEKFNMQIPLYIWMYSKMPAAEGKTVSGSIWRFDFMESREKEKYEKIYGGKKLSYLGKIEEFISGAAEKLVKGKADFTVENPEGCFYCPYGGMCPNEKNGL